MASAADHRRSVGNLVLMCFTIGIVVRLVQVADTRPPASIEGVIAAMNREIASVVIADQTFVFSTTLRSKDRTGAGEVIGSFSWPTEAQPHLGEALRVFSQRAEALCRRFGRRFDSAYGSEHPYADPKTQRTRVDLRFWISKPSLK